MTTQPPVRPPTGLVPSHILAQQAQQQAITAQPDFVPPPKLKKRDPAPTKAELAAALQAAERLVAHCEARGEAGFPAHFVSSLRSLIDLVAFEQTALRLGELWVALVAALSPTHATELALSAEERAQIRSALEPVVRLPAESGP